METDYSELLSRLKLLDNHLPKSNRASTYESNDTFPDDILPFDIYRGKRDNITKIGDQINLAYAYGIYDGCAILMRRLIEVLLILTFKVKGIEKQIKNSNGDFMQLSDIIARSENNPKLDFPRNSLKYLSLIKEQGDLSAHNPFHFARKKDIENIQPKFRNLVEVLLYTAEIMQ